MSNFKLYGIDFGKRHVQLCTMGRAAQRMNRVSIIPEDLQLFEVGDIPKVFDYMCKTFHLSSQWKKDYKAALMKVERGISEQEFFFIFVKEYIEPSLQIILRRKDVIFSLTRYIIRDRIAERMKEQEHHKNFYHSNQWKQGLKET